MAIYDGEARVSDFLGEGADESNLGDAPAMSEEEIRRMRDAQAQRAETARLADIPYGTPTSRGGTASTFEVTDQNIGTHAQPASQQTARLLEAGTTPAQAASSGVNTDAIQEDAARRADEGATDRGNALQGIIDRFDAAKSSFDTSQQDQSRIAQQQALQQNRELFTRANSFDRGAAAAKYSDEALANSLAIARSAPGGATRASALFNALEAQPSIEAEAQRQANAEGRAQQQVALQATQQLGQQATQTRSQDEAQAEAYTGIGLDVAKAIANSTGQNLQLDQRDREFLGEVALQAANLNLDVQKLGVDESLRRLELQLQKEGLDQEWKIFKASQKVTGKDILGGIFGLTGTAISTIGYAGAVKGKG